MLQLNHVLVATDFSETSNAVLAYGRVLARSFGATLTILHVADVVTTGIGEAGGKYSEAQHQSVETARTRADALLTAEDRQSLHTKAAALTSTEPAQAIVAYAEEEGIDVIVMGTHGRTGITHLLMGSVAEGVVRLATCPVLVVRHLKR